MRALQARFGPPQPAGWVKGAPLPRGRWVLGKMVGGDPAGGGQGGGPLHKDAPGSQWRPPRAAELGVGGGERVSGRRVGAEVHAT